jgi:hypothetical protein
MSHFPPFEPILIERIAYDHQRQSGGELIVWQVRGRLPPTLAPLAYAIVRTREGTKEPNVLRG